MTKIIIPVHSVVDLITNSSTEIYTSATDKTISTITDFANTMLSVGGSPLRAADVFDVKLVVADQEYGDKPFRQTASSVTEANKIIKIERRSRNGNNEEDYDQQWPRISSQLEITVKKPYDTNPQIIKVVEALAALGDTYNTEEISN